jgi:hypothetical protein
MNKSKFFRAAIPGENLTANSKNYPWHRPPQITEFDDAFEYFVDNTLMDDKKFAAGVSLVTNGVSAVAAVQGLLLNMVARGVVSPDMTLLMAGPVYKTFTKMLDVAGVTYLSGFDTPEEVAAYAEKMGNMPEAKQGKAPKLSAEQEAEMERITEEAKAEIPKGGLMGGPVEEVEESNG